MASKLLRIACHCPGYCVFVLHKGIFCLSTRYDKSHGASSMAKDYDRIMKLKMNAREGYDVTEAEHDLPLHSHLR